ncbi:class I SAM-dependent methyltransferase [Actinosynnema sp. NPDC047251]|uniref:Methyltransferase type 11 n=1 Tax=Saccharothrix espanaensis (strain ATCC 51144 / DSM 44229 / JCM 9112 / NBRC 15066 / NRRL 15764) TaxID=1179773 RepID=K0K1J3_SACES|nr:class I SAM-dependent methyltransferase [Saccharothrix espanaensis]CCH30729.1 Methyltransferase type 11 [Saccharothrix espanaensis DSM 44229]
MTDVTHHYTTAPNEADRLHRTPHGRLEHLRTRELVRRHMTSPARVLDVGGGTGVHARWPAADGHHVHLIDIVPDHVDTASRLPGVTASVGDARDLPVRTDTVDAVLLMGPLYHLLAPTDRAQALAEARRVLRPGGTLVAAAISRYLSALETGTTGNLGPALIGPVGKVIASGRYDGHVGFTETHWHTADELHDEISAAGFRAPIVYGVEGPAWPTLDAVGIDGFDDHVESALRCARLLETDPLMINGSAHFLAFARS